MSQAVREPIAVIHEESGGCDIHTTAGKIADLEHRLDEAVHAGSERAVEKQHARGRKGLS